MLRHGCYGHFLTLLEASFKRPAAACQHASHSRHLIVSSSAPIRTAATVSLLNTKQVREPQRIRPRKPIPEEKKLLEPHILSQRLKKLCDSGKLSEAIDKLKNAPLDAQNPPVWNTVIWECMKARQYQLAYKLYIDMKRRGFSPTTRTYQTMLSGLSKITDWQTHPKQLVNAHSLFDSFLMHVASVKKHDPESKQLDTAPINSYFRILGDAGLQQQMFDIYYEMNTEGPMAPDHLVYTAMFNALASRSSAAPDHNTSLSSMQHASNARLLWTLMLKARKKKDFPIDSFLITGAIAALSRGRPSDQAFAFTLAKDYFGLSLKDEEPVKGYGTLPLTSHSLSAVIALCNLSEHHSDAPYIIQQVIRRPEAYGGVSIIDRGIVDEVLRSLLSYPSPSASERSSRSAGEEASELVSWALYQDSTCRHDQRVRPRKSTLDLALSVCWRQADWRHARKIFETLTGWHLHDFADGVAKDRPSQPPKGGALLEADAEAASSLVRTAVASKNAANVREALRLVAHLEMLSESPTETTKVAKAEAEKSNKSMKSDRFFQVKLAEAVLEASTIVLSEKGNKNLDPAEWKGISESARKFLGTQMY